MWCWWVNFLGCGVFWIAACCPRAQNNRRKPQAISKKSFVHIPWCFLTLQNKRGIYRKLNVQHEGLTNYAFFLKHVARLTDLLWHVAMWLGCTCSKVWLRILTGFGPCHIFSACLAFSWMFPQYLFKSCVIPFENHLKISPCSSVLIPRFSSLHALVSPVSCLSCAPRSSFLTLLSPSAGKTLKGNSQRLLAQPCRGAYYKLHLHVLGVCAFFNSRSGMSHISDIKGVTGVTLETFFFKIWFHYYCVSLLFCKEIISIIK